MLIDPNQIRSFIRNIHLFGKLDDEQIEMVCAAFTPRLFQQGAMIYEAGGDALTFYLLYSGQVQLQRLVEGEPDFVENLEPGDYFGHEALGDGDYRQTHAVALEDTLVLESSAETLAELVANIPELESRLNLVQRSFHLSWQLPTKWREPGEVIYFTARRHIVYLVMRLILPAVVLLVGLIIAVVGEMALGTITPLLSGGFLLALGAGLAIWQLLDWSNDYFIVTDRRIIYLERIILFFDARTEAPMEAILSVSHDTSLLGRWFGFGIITVKSFTGTVRFDGIEAPREVQALVEKLLMRAQSRQRQEQRRTIDRTLRGRLRPPEQAPAPAAAPSGGEEEMEEQPVEYTPGALQKLLSTIFYMRWEENERITYRKHWLVLLANVWLPTLIILAAFILLVVRLLGGLPVLSIPTIVTLFLLALIITGLWWAYQYADWSNDVYVVTNDQIIDVYKKPLGTETRKTAPLKNILSIEYRRLGFWGYLFNYGTVYIKVGETTFDFDYVYNPAEVQREVFKRYYEFKYREQKAEEEKEAGRMADWIEGYDRLNRS